MLTFILVGWLALPFAPAAATCVPTCSVPAATPGYAAPLLVVNSGDTITWNALDQPHTATESATRPCFSVAFGGSAGSAAFQIVGGQLVAQQAATVPKTCASAQANPDGSFLVQYHCAYHSQMVAAILVRPVAGA